ncbi:MAG: DUF1963 domain-containing protein [Ruminococcaceae bacterium]|nr:DUF1963 domain-containing protein [Oscillospiraceae bacterium]
MCFGSGLFVLEKIMPELNDFLKELRKFYKTNSAPDAQQMSDFIRTYADEKGENYTYDCPDEIPYRYGGYFDSSKLPKYSSQTLSKLGKLMTAINMEIPPRPCVRFKPVRSECTLFDSKLGGTPYFPKDMQLPTVREGELQGRPLRLLAQLNFGALPHIEGFPEKGILQFFAGCDDDDVVGVDFKDYFNQNGFRVIYHADIIADESLLISDADMPEYDEDEFWAFPFKGEFLLKASAPEFSAISSADYRFEDTVVKCYNQLFGGEIVSLFGNKRNNELGLRMVDEKLYDALWDAFGGGTGAKIGGSPFFTQDDPRGYNEDFAKCDTLLFQLDSEGDGEDEIMWGDCGVGNFFINSDDLKNCDFSRVLYSWDCC